MRGEWVQYSNHKESILAYESAGMHVAETILGTTVPEIEADHRLERQAPLAGATKLLLAVVLGYISATPGFLSVGSILQSMARVTGVSI